MLCVLARVTLVTLVSYMQPCVSRANISHGGFAIAKLKATVGISNSKFNGEEKDVLRPRGPAVWHVALRVARLNVGVLPGRELDSLR